VENRVTRLGEFSPIGLFWAAFSKLTKEAKIFGVSVSTAHKSYVLVLTKNGVGYILSDFFTNPSGVDVMITIFCDFSQFSAKKLAFFLKTIVVIKTLHNLALF
jgi:hypothetical protein